MYKEYIELYQTYTKKYGSKTAIFLMVGSFYELYDIQDQETGETQANVRDIVDLLGIQLSNKKGDVGQGKDGLFAGFPDYVMHKWAGRLTSSGWTVVIVDQIKDAKGKVKERKVARILSPSTHIEQTNSLETPYVTTLYFEPGQNAPLFGAATLDLTTGTTKTYFHSANGRADIWTADDLVQMLSVYPPKELLIYWNGSLSTSSPDEAFFRRVFGLPSIPIHIYPIESLGSFEHALVRNEYFQKIYSIKSLLPPKTYLGLRSEQEELALLYLLQFVEEHDASMLKSFHRNESWTPNTRLICGNHALTQLQMTSYKPEESVLFLFDKCITVMGKRAIKERLLSPYSNPSEIRARLREVQEYMIWTQEKQKQLERQLRFMFDLPRLHRRLLCGLIQPNEIAGLFQTYQAVHTIQTQVTKETSLAAPYSEEQWLTYFQVMETHFNHEKAQQASQDQTAFSSQTYPDIAKKEAEIQDVLASFQLLKKEIATKGNVAEDAVRLEEREKEPFGLKGSTITLQQLKKNSAQLPEGITISVLKSGGWIDCLTLQQLNTKLVKLRESLAHLISNHLLHACQAISEAGQHLWTLMEHWICHVDGTQCIGKISFERGFSCPIIEDLDEEGSAVQITNVRHPLVEASATRTQYVKHNVSLRSGGWLVYGMNASGKSTLMKATGICVLLAQAGCFVPAKEMILKPFQAVYTRILNQDNLFAGLSSFAVEMSELRDILRNANPYTLVLGDELCAGTESTSAQALIASGIQWLTKRKAKFIFATHLHDLPKLIDLKSVEVWHLHVEYDPASKKLIYDRSLRPGSGSTLYGLEVARAMDLPFEFIEQALEYRHKILGSVKESDATSSSWNREIVRKECENCKKPMGLEVHHLNHRASAMNNRLEDGTHMNDKRNLVTICQACHDAVHANTLVIGNLIETSDGPERIVQHVVKVEKSKSKWTEEELETIKQTLQTYSSMSLKSIRAHLHSKHEIEVSEAILGKMRRELLI